MYKRSSLKYRWDCQTRNLAFRGCPFQSVLWSIVFVVNCKGRRSHVLNGCQTWHYYGSFLRCCTVMVIDLFMETPVPNLEILQRFIQIFTFSVFLNQEFATNLIQNAGPQMDDNTFAISKLSFGESNCITMMRILLWWRNKGVWRKRAHQIIFY